MPSAPNGEVQPSVLALRRNLIAKFIAKFNASPRLSRREPLDSGNEKLKTAIETNDPTGLIANPTPGVTVD